MSRYIFSSSDSKKPHLDVRSVKRLHFQSARQNYLYAQSQVL